MTEGKASVTRTYQVVAVGVEGILQEVGVVTHFPQLHHDVVYTQCDLRIQADILVSLGSTEENNYSRDCHSDRLK